ncbi:MAG TPA: hypothetical protein VFC24_18405 [Casimicrobiaceae bacterium]|nr:hypothetical protein [Casimicrobiaceae bacterium]
MRRNKEPYDESWSARGVVALKLATLLTVVAVIALGASGGSGNDEPPPVASAKTAPAP